ncbi:MAG: hypothetical protein WA125_00165 [Desulfosporosinus sp.]
MQSNSLAIVANIFPPAERGKYQGLMGGVLGKTASNSGFITTPMMLGLVIASTTSGQIVSRTGKYKSLLYQVLQ